MTPLSPKFDSTLHLPDQITSSADTELKHAAKDFEAAFISQMLTFSGLGDALVSGDGQMASAFTGFFVEALSEDLAETGAFGLAEKFYEKLKNSGGLS